MKKTPEMLKVEAETGRPVESLIREAVEKHGNVDEAAVEFHVTARTLRNWIGALGGVVLKERRTTVMFPARDSEQAVAA